MLILPPGHSQTLRSSRAITTREKWIVGSVLGCLTVLALIVVIAIASSEQKSTRTCINVTAPSFIGAEQVRGCGAQAREICRSAAQQGTYNQALAATIAAECRKVGLPVGS
ncbi:MAG TPA: hypothetical protein VMU39_23975 [Solirubrobacteraceae bacterium]|nr:hypothetical protein [Solirubrobacteraceae bacterium]